MPPGTLPDAEKNEKNIKQTKNSFDEGSEVNSDAIVEFVKFGSIIDFSWREKPMQKAFFSRKFIYI